MKTILKYILFICLLSCGESNKNESTFNNASHIQYFGFTLIDTYWDDPTDNEKKTNYVDEIYRFCNLGDILVVNPTDDIIKRVELFQSLDIKAILHLNEIFFELKDNKSPSGANYSLRKDFKSRWNVFHQKNQTVINTNHIGAFYIGEEPTWNGISFHDLNMVTDFIKNIYPEIPIMIIEASSALEDFKIPINADWIGFNHYFIKNPNTNSIFQKEWQLLKSKRSNVSQKLIVIMDSHHIKGVHDSLGGIKLEDMGEVAKNYYSLAQKNKDVIGIIGYFWPNGFDNLKAIGVRSMPDNIKKEYIHIGKEITKK